MDAVERGETFRVTRRGVEIAELRPIPSDMFTPTAAVKKAFGRLPIGDFAAMRAEADQVFGEDRVGD